MTRGDRESERSAFRLLFSFPETGGFAFQSTQVVKLGAANTASAHDIDMVHHRSVQRENALDALSEANLADGDGLAHAGIVLGDDGAFERLQAFLVAFLDLDVHPDGVSRAEIGMLHRPLVLNQNLVQQGVVHLLILNSKASSKSGRNRAVFSIAASLRHFRIASWLPPSSVSGTFQPRNSAGRVYCGQSSNPSSPNDSYTAES